MQVITSISDYYYYYYTKKNARNWIGKQNLRCYLKVLACFFFPSQMMQEGVMHLHQVKNTTQTQNMPKQTFGDTSR